MYILLPRMTGMFWLSGAVLKWLSIQWAPDSRWMKLSNPIFNAIVIPIADQRE
jgi:hypothetical protein